MIVCLEPLWDHESFMDLTVMPLSKDLSLPMIPEDQTDLWRSQLPLPRTPAPRCSSHLKDFIQNMPWFLHKKKSSLCALRQSASPMWRDLNQSCDWKMIVVQANWQRKLPRGRVKNKNTQVSNVKAGNHVARRVNRVLDVFFWLQNESVSKLAGGSKGNATPQQLSVSCL